MASSPSNFKKVVIVVFENANYDRVMANNNIKKLNQYGVSFSHMMAETHPSQGNYIAMIAGSLLGVKNDKVIDLNESHLGDLLEKANMKWKVYAEDYPGNCFKEKHSGLYARRHVPFLSFLNVSTNGSRCLNIENEKNFLEDYKNGSLPEFSMYIPNVKNDGHDSNIDFSSNYILSKFGSILTNPSQMKDVLFIITYDESGASPVNQIYTAFFGANIKPATTNDQVVNHYSILRMIEEEFNIGNLGREDSKAMPIVGIWKN
jgi:phospholipase C